MQTNQLKVSFFVQAKRADKQGDAPIFERIIIGRSTADFSTKFRAPLTLWDSRRQRLLGKSHVAVQLNQRLNDCTALIHTRYRELCEREEAVTAPAVRDAYQGQIQEQGFLLATYQAYLTQIEERIGIDRASTPCSTLLATTLCIPKRVGSLNCFKKLVIKFLRSPSLLLNFKKEA